MKRRLVIVIPILLVIVLSVAVTNIFPFRRMIALDRAIAAEQVALTEIEAENRALAAERDALLTDAEVERVAREKYGYVKPGEQPYVVVTPDVEVLPPPPAVEPEPDRAWYDVVVDWVTGRDLSD